jgi:hypothetical protein
MRKLRILFIVMGLVGAFYLNGAGNRAQASPGAVDSPCEWYDYPTGPRGSGCSEYGQNCEDGSGYWCSYCSGVEDCYYW